MAVTVKKAVLWRKELENRPGTLAEALRPLSEAGISLQVVMAYAIPGEPEHAAVEVFPINGNKAEQAASEAGLEESPRIACLLVSGDDSPGLGHAIAESLAENGINISFVMVQVSGQEYHGTFGFESQEEADRAIPIIKQAGRAATVKRRATAARTAQSGRTAAGGTKARGGRAKSTGGSRSKSTGNGRARTARAGSAGRSSSSRATTSRKSADGSSRGRAGDRRGSASGGTTYGGKGTSGSGRRSTGASSRRRGGR